MSLLLEKFCGGEGWLKVREYTYSDTPLSIANNMGRGKRELYVYNSLPEKSLIYRFPNPHVLHGEPLSTILDKVSQYAEVTELQGDERFTINVQCDAGLTLHRFRFTQLNHTPSLLLPENL